MKNFSKIFYRIRHQDIILYGLGEISRKIIDENPNFNIIGVCGKKKHITKKKLFNGKKIYNESQIIKIKKYNIRRNYGNCSIIICASIPNSKNDQR